VGVQERGAAGIGSEAQMSDEAIKRRIADAKMKAKQKFLDVGYIVYNSDNEIFCFIANKIGCHECKVRVVVDKITDQDIELVRAQRILLGQTKAIWCRKYGCSEWVKLEFDHLNNACQ